jgi:Cys-tRNA(Pro)/Cys-tRNA(Cys) deacylase
VAGRGTPALTVLVNQGINHQVHEYRHDPEVASYGLEAAEALGQPPQRVFKTLVAEVDGALSVGIVPVIAQLDLKALATALAGKRAKLAGTAQAEKATGYVAGGISPLGQKRGLPVVLDRSALDFDTIYCSGGRRGLEIELAPSDLVALTKATVAHIATY